MRALPLIWFVIDSVGANVFCSFTQQVNKIDDSRINYSVQCDSCGVAYLPADCRYAGSSGKVKEEHCSHHGDFVASSSRSYPFTIHPLHHSLFSYLPFGDCHFSLFHGHFQTFSVIEASGTGCQASAPGDFQDSCCNTI